MCWLQTRDSENNLQFPQPVLARSTTLMDSTRAACKILWDHLSDTIYPIFFGSCLAQPHQQPTMTLQSTGHSCNEIVCCTTEQLLGRTSLYNKYYIYFIKRNWTVELHCWSWPCQKCMSFKKKKKKGNKKLPLTCYWTQKVPPKEANELRPPAARRTY